MINYYNSKVRNKIIKKATIKEVCKQVTYKKCRKRKGFTLIEIIAVIAIIGILATAILPNVNGYIKEAKKVKVMDQCRKVVMAAESYRLRYDKLEDDITVERMKDIYGVSKYLDEVNLSNLPGITTLKQCYSIVNGAEFDIEGDNDMLKTLTATNTASVPDNE